MAFSIKKNVSANTLIADGIITGNLIMNSSDSPGVAYALPTDAPNQGDILYCSDAGIVAWTSLNSITGAVAFSPQDVSSCDLIIFGLYRGILSSSTLIAQGGKNCVAGSNVIELSAAVNLVAGENIVVGLYIADSSWLTVYDKGVSDVVFGLKKNTVAITTMPLVPEGVESEIRFACTLYS